MNTNRLTILGGSIAIILIIVLGYLLGMSPKLAEADEVLAQKQVVDTENATQQAQLDMLRQKFSKIDTLRAEYAALQTAIPLTPNSPDFVDQVKNLADANGVIVMAISLADPAGIILPEEPKSAAAGKSSSAASPTSSPRPTTPAAAVSPAVSDAKALVGKLFYSAVKITVGGDSTSVFNFVSALQQGQRLFLSDQVAVTAGGNTPGAIISGYVLVVPVTSAATPAE